METLIPLIILSLYIVGLPTVLILGLISSLDPEGRQ